jgi:putative MFS transporter
LSTIPAEAGGSSPVLTEPDEEIVQGTIAARIDRLPVLGYHYAYAGITQLFWGIMIAADGVVASLYPFLWAPQGLISSFQFDVLLGTNLGAGILIGEYLGGFLSDMVGRKWTLVLAALVEGLFIWPIARTDAFWWLELWNLLFALGMGMLLSANAVYIHEIAPPQSRQKLSLRTQAIAPIVAAGFGGGFSYYWVPSHYDWYLYVLSAAPIVILIPLGLFVLPESPRWLEGKGRVSEADQIVKRWENAAIAKYGQLPEPDPTVTIVKTEHVPVKEVFTGQYKKQTFLLWAVWFLGYSGIVYGFGSFFPTFAVVHIGWDAHQLFFWSKLAPLPVILITFYAVAAFGERYERKAWAMASGTVFAILVLLMLVTTSNAYLYFLAIVSVAFIDGWLFTMYNYTSAAYPTRLRSVGTGWTDGVGHLGSILGTSLLVGRLFDWTLTDSPAAWGWILYCAIPGAFIPALLLFIWGQNQKGQSLESLAP